MPPPVPLEPDILHTVKNRVALIVSLTDLAMLELPTGDVRADLLAIREAGTEVLALLPRLVSGHQR